MKKNVLVVAAVVLVVGCVAWLKNRAPAESEPTPAGYTSNPSGLPRLVELGAGKCTACKQMKPIIEELKREYAGRLQVDSIDVIDQADEARVYDWHLIPCQVFIAPDGKELWRHEGFIAKIDILAKWKELGFGLDGAEDRPGV